MSGKGKIHEHPNVNTNGFDKNPQNINRKGAPLSFKKRYRELYQESNGVIWVPEKIVLHRTRKEKVKDDKGKTKEIEINEVGLPLSKQEQVITKLDRLMANATDSVALRAIQFIWEQIDGKPKQEIEQKTTHDFEGDPFAKIRENAGVDKEDKKQ